MSAPWNDPDGEALAAERERDYCEDNNLCVKCHCELEAGKCDADVCCVYP